MGAGRCDSSGCYCLGITMKEGFVEGLRFAFGIQVRTFAPLPTLGDPKSVVDQGQTVVEVIKIGRFVNQN